MTNYFLTIESLLPSVLDTDVRYTPTSAAEEFRQEYPDKFNEFMKEYSEEFQLSGCGQRRGHINGFAIMLDHLEQAGIMKKINDCGSTYWRKLK